MKVLGLVLSFLGVLLILLGSTLTSAYIWYAVLERIGEPDQSLLYWYLPFLMFGLIGMTLGWKLFQLGKSQKFKSE